MEKTVIKASSPELAKERKLVREIIEELKSKLGKTARKYQFRRIEEKYGGYSDGYYAEYILIESGKRERLFQEMKLSFATCGSNWDHRNYSDRVVVRIWGSALIKITDPRNHRIEQTVYGGDNEITFNRDRARHIQGNAVAKVLEVQQERYDGAVQRVLTDTARWDKFAATVKRIQRTLNIPGRRVWRSVHMNQYEVHLSIVETKSRKTSGVIIVDVGGTINIKINDLTEPKLLKVVSAFR